MSTQIAVHVPSATTRALRVVGLLRNTASIHLIFIHASADSGAAIAPVLRDAGFKTVTQYDTATHAHGTHANVRTLFGIALHQVECGTTKAQFYTHLVNVDVPASLQPHVSNVLGLNSFPVARPCLHAASAKAAPLLPNKTKFLITELRTAYGLPAPTANTGKGIKIGVIELGGGYFVDDLKRYIALCAPLASDTNVRSVSVQGARNNPYDGSGSNLEVALDIQLILGTAPGASVNVYFAPNSFDGFYAAIRAAQIDKCAIVSISWAATEGAWSRKTMQNYDALLQSMSAAGITVFAAAGDYGASDGQRGLHVEFPASSPNIVACGGTSLRANPSFVSESTWYNNALSATGGGFSTVFARPPFQPAIKNQSMRGVPDVSADADPATGHIVILNGAQTVVGGTSAVAPLYAGFLAQLYTLKPSTPRGTAAFLRAAYASPSKFYDITTGSNGGFSAAKNWDACTGMGRLNAAFFQ